MDFKVRGKTIQVVRMNKDGDGESGSESLGTVKAPTYAPDATLQAKLSPDELREVLGHAARRVRTETLAREYAVHALPDTLRLALDWLKTANSAEALAFVEEIRTPFGKLRRLVAKVAVNEADE